MSYGSPEWQDWVLGEEEGIKHIKAYVFQTQVRPGTYSVTLQGIRRRYPDLRHGRRKSHGHKLDLRILISVQTYSNGLSEVVLGKAIKQHNLPRDEIVIMTKVRNPVCQ